MGMGTKDALRKRVLRLLELGVTQKAIAGRMGMSQAALSRWINDEAVRISVDALDGYNAFECEFLAALSDSHRETQRSAAADTRPAATGTAGPTFHRRESDQ
jgi:transcriptional regulator with XRE-family HTH domain